MSDPIPAEERPHRVSALSGLDPDPETTGIDPSNRAQGTGRPDDDEHAERVAASQEAQAEAAASARGEDVEVAGVYDLSDVPENAADVVSWLQAAANPNDRAARADLVDQVEHNREGGPRKTVLDELAR